MSDQCQHCTLRGDVEACREAKCHLHETWYALSFREAAPDDIRAMGWSVAVHSDYRLKGEPRTSWLFSKGDCVVSGEGRTDVEALNAVRAKLSIGDVHSVNRRAQATCSKCGGVGWWPESPEMAELCPQCREPGEEGVE